MKSRHSPNLYEILRSASTPAPAAREAAPEPAAAVAVAPPPPPPPVPVREPEPIIEASSSFAPARAVAVEEKPAPVVHVYEAPAPRPAAEPASSFSPDSAGVSEEKGPGERSVRLTYNTLLFGGLVVLGVVFLSFTLGVRTGRNRIESPAPATEIPAVVPVVPAGPAPVFTIRLVEFRARTHAEYTRALASATDYKLGLERAGFRNAEVKTLGESPDRRVVLAYGEFPDAASRDARETLKKLQAIRLDRNAREGTFARTAQFQAK